MFPSWLEHEVLEQGSKQDRISLAFNSYPKGHIGKELNNLKYYDYRYLWIDRIW